MAAPSVAATAGTQGTSASSWAISYPAFTGGSSVNNKGDTLMLFLRTGANVASFTLPSGWNIIGNMSNEASQRELIAWRRIDGTESGTFTVTPNITSKCAAITMLITGAADPNTRAPEVAGSAAFTGTANTHPDPNLVAPTGGARDALYVGFGSWPFNTGVTTYPSGYTGVVQLGAAAAATDCSVAAPYKATTGATADDAGQYTIATSRTWTARGTVIHPGNYLKSTIALGPTITIAAIATKFAALTRNLGLTITAAAVVSKLAVITRNFGPTISVAALRIVLAQISRNLGMTITVNAIGTGDKIISATISLGPTITVAAQRTALAAISRALGPTVTVTAQGLGYATINMPLGPTVTVSAGRKVLAAVSAVLGWVTHICAHVNPKFLRPFTEDTLTATAEAEDTLALTAEAEDPFSVVVLAEVVMNLTAEAEDTLTLTTETEETTEC